MKWPTYWIMTYIFASLLNWSSMIYWDQVGNKWCQSKEYSPDYLEMCEMSGAPLAPLNQSNDELCVVELMWPLFVRACLQVQLQVEIQKEVSFSP